MSCQLLRFVFVFSAVAAGALSVPLPEDTTRRWTIRETSEGGWTLVRPDGKPQFVTALNHLASPYYYDVIQGANGLAPCRSYDPLCKANDLLQTKYRGNWTAATVDFINITSDFGFNAAGYEFVPAEGVHWPYFPDLFVTNVSHIFQHARQMTFPDVFSAEFNQSTDARVQKWIALDQHTNQKRVLTDVIGYYFEDQPLWNRQTGACNTTTPQTWPDAIRAMPHDAAGKSAYISWLRSLYGTSKEAFEDARRVYNIPNALQNWSVLESWNFDETDVCSDAVESDDVKFMGIVADQLYSVGAGAVRRYDPQALVFGTRFISHDAPVPVLEAAGRHFDAIAVQPSIFSPSSAEQVATSVQTLINISKTAGKPVFVADQATHFVETLPGVPPTNWGQTPNQSVAGDMYTRFVSGVWETGLIVGYAHCQYVNRLVNPPSTGLHLKQGLLNFDGTPHREYTNLIRTANHKVTSKGQQPFVAEEYTSKTI